MRADKNNLIIAAIGSKATFQPRDEGGWRLRHLPSRSGFIFCGNTRECIFFMHGMRFEREQGMPLKARMFDSTEKPEEKKTFKIKHLNGAEYVGKATDWRFFLKGAAFSSQMFETKIAA